MLKGLISTLCLVLLTATATANESQAVRPAAVAGSWYPGDRIVLTSYIDELLQKHSPAGAMQGPVRALIVPHAGYRYSGDVAAAAYRLLKGQPFKRVLLLGPSHYGRFQGLSIADVTHYQTPLGQIPLDMQAIKRLRQSGKVTSAPLAHQHEHSLEMQLPFLQRVLQPGWQLIPVLVGQLEPDDYLPVSVLLRPLVDAETLVIVSSDFTHYGQRFDYLPFALDSQTATRLETLDKGSLKHILNKDPHGFVGYRQRTGTTICGYRPITLLLHMLPADSVGELVTYTTSGELTGNYETSVSYMGIVFRGPENSDNQTLPQAGRISQENMQLLHRLASTAVEIAARPQDKTARQRLKQLQELVPPGLKIPSGAFVTLRKAGQLRGCIGITRPTDPLYRTVMFSGNQAALNDSRFYPLRAEELVGLDVEVTVLTPPRPLDSYQDFIIGKEGIILEKNGHSAVFLPKVAERYNGNREKMLNMLALKAGLPAESWKNGSSFKTFRTQSFSAPFSSATP